MSSMITPLKSPKSSSNLSQELSSSIALVIQPHPTNTYYTNDNYTLSRSTSSSLPTIYYYYYQSPPPPPTTTTCHHHHCTDQVVSPLTNPPSLLQECFRYFQSLPPSQYFFPSMTSTPCSKHSEMNLSQMKQGYPQRKIHHLNHRHIFNIQLFPFGSTLRDLSKLPYFNYDLYFHYDYPKFSIMRKIMSLSLIVGLGTFAKFFLNVLNHSKFYGKDLFRKTIEEHYERVQRERSLAMTTTTTTIITEPTSLSTEITTTEPTEPTAMITTTTTEPTTTPTEPTTTSLSRSTCKPFIMHSSTQKKIRGLLTVVNHNSMLDEPILMSGLCPLSWFLRSDIIRYAVCASDMCFGHFLLGEFFKTVKVLPIKRQGGLEQHAMKLIVDKLSSGGWINVFPEGRIYVDGEIHTCRRGIGKLIYDCDPTPHIYPIYHHGLSDVLPYDGIIPRIGKKITIMFQGDEIDVQDLVQKGRQGEMTPDQVYVAISKRVEEGMKQLKRKCEEVENVE